MNAPLIDGIAPLSPPMSSGETHHGHEKGMAMAMAMTFEHSTHVTVLFSWWVTETVEWYLLTCVFWFAATLFYEWLGLFRLEYEKRLSGQFVPKSDNSDDSEEKAQGNQGNDFTFTGLYVFQMFLSYLIMLVFMSMSAFKASPHSNPFS